jgi:P-type Cu+ transporter
MEALRHLEVIQVPVKGMDCAGCTQTVQRAIAQIPGVETVDVLLSSEKAVIKLDPNQVQLTAIHNAVKQAGYSVPEPEAVSAAETPGDDFTKRVLTLLGIVFGAVLFIVVFGEWLGVFEALTSRVPWYVGLGIVLVAGFPVFRNVVEAALRRQIISHTLMTVGVIAALAVGEWATAAVVVFFMRIAEYAEHFTTERARQAVKHLTSLVPQTARIEHAGGEQEIAINQVQVGDIVIVRPGENIPVDGEVLTGQATVNQAAITGESMPVEVGAGSKVFAATIATLGSLRIRTTHIGSDTTFGKVIKLVEEAEAHRADVQRIGDTFATYYLPVVAVIALLTFLIRRDPLATAAVLLVACSCSFALATPIAMLATIGAAAKRGLLIKGGKYIETLAKADVLLIDKTGTLTIGQPQVTDVVTLNGYNQQELLSLAASAEKYSEHPLAEAVRTAAVDQGLTLQEPTEFKALPGAGIKATINRSIIAVGSHRMLSNGVAPTVAQELQAQGKTLLYVIENDEPIGVIATADTMRSEVPEALKRVRELGITQIELLTGDNERTAKTLAEHLGVQYQANLLPEDKIRIVKEYQAQGKTVLMVGDGVNDAPALAQANVGIAMGVAGTDVAIEAAHVALMREDWSLVPEVLHIAKRTMNVVQFNIGFTAVYNVIGLSLAAVGILPPLLAAAAQSLPDLGIMANSSRLLRYQGQERTPFSWKRWTPVILVMLAALFVASMVGYLVVVTNPGIDQSIKTAVEAVATLTMMGSFLGGLILAANARMDKVEAENGGVIPLPDCVCCAPESNQLQPLQKQQLISLENIEVK